MKFKSILLTLGILVTGGFAQALEVGQEAPCVVLDHVQQGQASNHCIREPQVEGKPVIIEFFSITCSACQANLPNIKHLASSLAGEATVRLVSIDRSVAAVSNYISKNGIQLEVAFDVDRDAKRAYDVIQTPTLFILDQNNIVIEKHEGVLTPEQIIEIENKVRSLN